MKKRTESVKWHLSVKGLRIWRQAVYSSCEQHEAMEQGLRVEIAKS